MTEVEIHSTIPNDARAIVPDCRVKFEAEKRSRIEALQLYS